MVEYKIGQKVRIRQSGVVGWIVDIRKKEQGYDYTVESDSEDATGGYGGQWPLFDCSEEDLEALPFEGNP